jgi:hypothetical protein
MRSKDHHTIFPAMRCLVAGENPYNNAFNIKINEAETVAELKKSIKEIQKPFFDNVAFKDLKLWKVNIPLDSENEKLSAINTNINVNIKEDLEGVEMSALSKISKHFPTQSDDEHIHIVIQHPIEVHCTAMYGRKSKKFQLTVTCGQITLSILKSRLRVYFTFPDGTEDEHIVISRECGENKISLSDDDELASVIWTQGSKMDLPIVVDTCKYCFIFLRMLHNMSNEG